MRDAANETLGETLMKRSALLFTMLLAYESCGLDKHKYALITEKFESEKEKVEGLRQYHCLQIGVGCQ